MSEQPNDSWITPPDFYKKLYEIFQFSSFDPCPFPRPEDFDGLILDWKGDKIFLNPPYSCILPWIIRAVREKVKGKLSVFLLPARTDSDWFHLYALKYGEIHFLKRRLKFINPKTMKQQRTAPFSSLLVVFYPCGFDSEGTEKKLKKLFG